MSLSSGLASFNKIERLKQFLGHSMSPNDSQGHSMSLSSGLASFDKFERLKQFLEHRTSIQSYLLMGHFFTLFGFYVNCRTLRSIEIVEPALLRYKIEKGLRAIFLKRKISGFPYFGSVYLDPWFCRWFGSVQLFARCFCF